MDALTILVLLWTDISAVAGHSGDMRQLPWGLVFVTVIMLSNPGVDVPLSRTPALVLVAGSLALVANWLAAARRTAPARSTLQPTVRVRREMTESW